MASARTGTGVGRKIKVVAAIPGLDTHERGIRFICQVLQQAGMETIYLGFWQTPEAIVKVAIQEDVDVIAISTLGASPVIPLTEIVRLLKENNRQDIRVVAGGIIPDEDKPALLEMGVTGLYGPGVSAKVIVEHIRGEAEKRRKEKQIT